MPPTTRSLPACAASRMMDERALRAATVSRTFCAVAVSCKSPASARAFSTDGEMADTSDEICPGYSADCVTALTAAATRSEEHTSELQSRENLVCRLLLEKK